jgi:hypothetical protein
MFGLGTGVAVVRIVGSATGPMGASGGVMGRTGTAGIAKTAKR